MYFFVTNAIHVFEYPEQTLSLQIDLVFPVAAKLLASWTTTTTSTNRAIIAFFHQPGLRSHSLIALPPWKDALT